LQSLIHTLISLLANFFKSSSIRVDLFFCVIHEYNIF